MRQIKTSIYHFYETRRWEVKIKVTFAVNIRIWRLYGLASIDLFLLPPFAMNFICYTGFVLSPFVFWSQDVTRIPSSSGLLWSPSFSLLLPPPFPSSFGTNTMIEATSASPSTTTASSRLFVTAKGEVPGSRIDLRVIGNPSAVNLGKLVSTSSLRDLLLFPPGRREKEFLRRPCVYSAFGQI